MIDTRNIVMIIPKRKSIITIIFVTTWIALALHHITGTGTSNLSWLFFIGCVFLVGVLVYELFGKVEIALEDGKLVVSKKIFSKLISFSTYELSKVENVRYRTNEKGESFLSFGRSTSPEFLRWYYGRNPVIVYFRYDGDKEIKIGEGLEAFDSKKLIEVLKYKR